MVLKKITIHLPLDSDAAETIRTQFPAIVQEIYYSNRSTTFIVDIAPEQEDQIRPVLLNAIIQIETL